ncbi:MAG: TonB-dependent receptor [Salinivirgaceae bacterium]|nr:TonB-dependent receptor [Salinivirgaceae bacterium]
MLKLKIGITTYLTLLFWITISSSLAQNNITGYVFSKTTKEPLSFANVAIQGTTIGSSTSMDGKFNIKNIKSGSYTLVASFSGFLTEETQIEINSNLEIEFYLEETSYDINTIVVTGTRTPKLLKNAPVLTHVIDKKEIESIGTSNIEDALSLSLPNINFRNSKTGVSMQLSGLEGKYTLFLIDGEKISGETNGNIDYNRLKTNDIDRIEIIKGASGLLYGSNAIGGVVNIITNTPKQTFEASIGSRYSKYNELDIDANVSLIHKKLSSKTNFYLNSTDGYDLTPETPYEKTQEAFKSKSAKQKFEYKFSDKINVELLGSYYDRERFDSDPVIFQHKKDYDFSYNIKSTYRINRENSISAVWHSDTYITKDIEELFDNRETTAYENRSSNARLMGVFKIFDKNTFNTGIEYTEDKLVTHRINADKNRLSNLIAFAQNEVEIVKHLTTIAGVRTNLHSVYGFHAIPQISTMYKLEPLRFRAGYSMGFRSPGIKEMYMEFSPVPIVVIHGNPNLNPESAHYFSLSAEYSKSILNTSVSLYQNNITDMITEVQSLTDPRLWRYENINSVRVNGVDFVLRAKLNYGFSVNASYSYTDSEDKTTGKQLLGSSHNNAGLMVQYNYSKKRYNLGVNLKANYYGEVPYKEMDEISGETASKMHDEHLIWNLTTTHNVLSGVVLTLGVQNIFDTYELNNIMNLFPGRRFFMGLRINIHKLKFNS